MTRARIDARHNDAAHSMERWPFDVWSLSGLRYGVPLLANQVVPLHIVLVQGALLTSPQRS